MLGNIVANQHQHKQSQDFKSSFVKEGGIPGESHRFPLFFDTFTTNPSNNYTDSQTRYNMKLHKTAHTKTTSCLASASKKFEDELKQGAYYNAKMLG